GVCVSCQIAKRRCGYAGSRQIQSQTLCPLGYVDPIALRTYLLPEWVSKESDNRYVQVTVCSIQSMVWARVHVRVQLVHCGTRHVQYSTRCAVIKSKSKRSENARTCQNNSRIERSLLVDIREVAQASRTVLHCLRNHARHACGAQIF